MRVLQAIRPIEWALFAYVLFVLIWAGGPAAFGGAELLFSRSTSILAALGVLAWAREFARLLSTPWASTAPRPIVWLALPLALIPGAFATWLALHSRVVSELPGSDASVVLAAGFGVVMSVFTMALPTALLWVLWARHVQAGNASWSDVKATLWSALGVLRDWLPLLIIISSYGTVNAHPEHDFDAFFVSVDRALFFGHDPQDLLEPLIHPWASEVLAFVYSFYALLYPLVLCGIYATGGRAAIQRASFTMGLALLIAYASYELIPVKGPMLSRTFTVPLDFYVAGPVKEALMDKARITYDCFPSLHTCCTLLLAEAAWTWARRLFWAVSPAVALMPLACVYLRYHYVADLIAGALLAAALVALTNRHFARRPAGYP